jgi:hypothetical protein
MLIVLYESVRVPVWWHLRPYDKHYLPAQDLWRELYQKALQEMGKPMEEDDRRVCVGKPYLRFEAEGNVEVIW